jgi:hypothetical protein
MYLNRSDEEHRWLETDVLEKLRFRRRWVPNDADIDITTKVHSFWCLFVDTTHELKEQSLLHDFVAVDGWSYACNEPRIDMV